MNERDSIGRQVVKALAFVTGSVVIGLPLLLVWHWTEKLAGYVQLGPYRDMAAVSHEISRLYLAIPPTAGHGALIPPELAAQADQLAYRCFMLEYVALLPIAAFVIAFLAAFVSVSRRTACAAGPASAAMAFLAGVYNYGRWTGQVGLSGGLQGVPVQHLAAIVVAGAVLCVATGFLGHGVGTKLITGSYHYSSRRF